MINTWLLGAHVHAVRHLLYGNCVYVTCCVLPRGPFSSVIYTASPCYLLVSWLSLELMSYKATIGVPTHAFSAWFHIFPYLFEAISLDGWNKYVYEHQRLTCLWIIDLLNLGQTRLYARRHLLEREGTLFVLRESCKDYKEVEASRLENTTFHCRYGAILTWWFQNIHPYTIAQDISPVCLSVWPNNTE